MPYLINPSEKIVSNPSKVRLLNATKLTGRTDKGLGIGVMNAVTANMYAEIQDTVTGETRKILTEPLVNYNVLVLDQQLKNNSNIWFMNTNVMRDKGFDDVNMSSAGYTLFNKKNTLASDGNFALSQNYSEDTAAGVNTVTDKIGYSYFLGVRKTGGNFEYGVGHEVFNNTFERRDLGYFAINNYSSFNYYLAFHQFQPWKFLRSSYMGMNFHHSNSFTTRELTGMSFNLDAFHTALSYFAFYYGVNVSPASTYDYFEPRVPGRYYRRCQTWYSWAGISTDYRKKVALDLGSHITNFFSDNAQHLPDLVGYGINPSIRYRVNDKLTVKYSMEYAYDPYNDGFADIDVNGDIIFGGRKLVTFVNGLNVKYIFMNDMSLSFNARHYWNTGEYQDYFTLGEFGWLLPNDTYTGNRNFNYNAFNIDMVYSWQFAPGSLLTLVYKNAIETESPIIIRKFSDDLTQTLQSPQTNGVSLKLLYYLDYQYLKKKK